MVGELGDGVDAEGLEGGCAFGSYAPEFAHGQGVEELLDPVWGNNPEPVGFAPGGGHFGDEFSGGDSNGAG